MPLLGRKVLHLWLVRDFWLESDGTTTDRYAELEVPQAEGLGMYAESFRVVSRTENRSANHQWNVGVQWSLDGKIWRPTTPTPLFTKVTTNDSVIHPEYTGADNFAAPHLRWTLAVSNTTGAAREGAYVSALVITTLKS